MVQIIKANEPYELDPAPSSVDEEIMQNVRVLLSTIKHDVPLAREMGLSTEYLGKPLPVAETLLYQTIADTLEEYEPRAELVSITFEQDTNSGTIIPIVEVKTSE